MSDRSNKLTCESFSEWGSDIQAFVKELYSLFDQNKNLGGCELLQGIYQHIPLLTHEVTSGKAVFDWMVPQEWKVKKAYLKDSQGNTLIDFHKDVGCLAGNSQAIKGFFSWEELIPHLISNSAKPHEVPTYSFSTKDQWAFCVPYTLFDSLGEDIYEVCIDSEFSAGYLCYGEYYIPGESQEEILICTHFDYPFVEQSNFPALGIATFLAKYLDQQALRRYSYRFLFVPSEIGTTTWLALNQDQLDRVRQGLVLSFLGATGEFSYQKSNRPLAEIDRAFEYLSHFSSKMGEPEEFSPLRPGSRQFCSPGFNLPVGSLSRGFPSTPALFSHDPMIEGKGQGFVDSLGFVLDALDILEGNEVFENLHPYCEPNWEKRGFFEGGEEDMGEKEAYHHCLLWIWSQSDGKTDLLQIALRSGLPFSLLQKAAKDMEFRGLLRPLPLALSLEKFTHSISR